jgi:hypothetical protein
VFANGTSSTFVEVVEGKQAEAFKAKLLKD